MFISRVALLAAALTTAVHGEGAGLSCDTANAQRLHIDDPPVDNYFYADCHGSSHVLVKNPTSGADRPETQSARLIVAWPAGNSGAALYFAPKDGPAGSLSIQLRNSSTGRSLEPVYVESADSEHPQVGVSGRLEFSASATLNVTVLGSIRSLRD